MLSFPLVNLLESATGTTGITVLGCQETSGISETVEFWETGILESSGNSGIIILGSSGISGINIPEVGGINPEIRRE